MKYKSILFFMSILIILVSCKDEQVVADLVVLNATIWTGNTEKPNAESMAIKGDSIIAIGSNEELNSYIKTAKEVFDVKGAFITPGFIDSHVHLMMGGNALLSVQLRDAETKNEFINRISLHADKLNPGDWILEGNWDHTLWGAELPTKEWIDAHTKENPVVLYRLDGHMVLANSLALKIAGINRDTPDVDGGKIIKNELGEPTGILKGNAMTVLLNKIPPMSIGQKEEALLAAQNYLVSNGVTSVHDLDSLGTHEIAEQLLDKNNLKIRVYAANPLNR
jgi:predicted amidohydrolase YtcJ